MRKFAPGLFTFDVVAYRAQPSSYVLVAETATGTSVKLEPFNVRGGQIARWNMETNRVLVTDR